jgi:transposase
LAREISRHGHTVILMAPQFVKPYVKSNKNDVADAEAICDILQALSPYRQHPSRFGMYELRDSEVGPIDYDVQLELAKSEDKLELA